MRLEVLRFNAMQGVSPRIRRIGLRTAAALVGTVLGLYSAGMGVYAVASTRPEVPSEPETADEARATLVRLGVADAYPFEHGFFDAPHGRMHYAEAGAGRPVLLLHGSSTWSFVYRNLAHTLGPGHRTIAPDLIGFGLSQKLSRPKDYSVQGHIEDVAALIEALDLSDITLVVHEWGGPIGLGVLLAHPDRISSVVVVNTFGFSPQMPPARTGAALALRAARIPVMGEQLVQGLSLVQRVVLEASLEGETASGAATGDRDEDDDVLLHAYLDVQGSWPARAGALAFPRLVPTRPDDPTAALLARAADALRERPPRALILWGRDDPIFGPDLLDEWRRVLPAARVVEVAGTGQAAIERPIASLASAIEAFVDNDSEVTPSSTAQLREARPSVKE